MKKILLLLAATALALTACEQDIFPFGPDGPGSFPGDQQGVSNLYDPSLSWSADSYEAVIGSENSFPTLSNTYSVNVTYTSSQSVYNMSGTAGAWNALHNGQSFIAAFKAPSRISSFIVSAPSLTSGYKGVNVSGYGQCDGVWATEGISGGTSVTLSKYNASASPR